MKLELRTRPGFDVVNGDEFNFGSIYYSEAMEEYVFKTIHPDMLLTEDELTQITELVVELNKQKEQEESGGD